jgi:NAD(P)-dependent dehydrogenase (short-subunit alcohol dehydrogenase family)
MSRVMIVTGAARGIGAATARLAARRGYAVAVNYRSDAAAARGVVEEIAAEGGTALAIAADVSRGAEVEALFSRADEALGKASVLVNNAGVVDVQARVDAMSEARIRRMLEINVLGSFLCAREAVRRMSTQHGGSGGSIVNVSSAAARHGSAGEYVDYAASKAAIDTFTLGLAREVAGEGIRVNAVRPGIILTGIHASGGDPERATRMAPALPMRRAGTPEEVANAILWFCGDESGYCTGSILDVAGGR